LAAAGLLVVVLPLSGAATASAQLRTEARAHGRVADSAFLLDAVGTTAHLAGIGASPLATDADDDADRDDEDGRPDDPGRAGSPTGLSSATDTSLPRFVVHAANLTSTEDAATRAALQSDIQEAVDSASVAVARAHDALAQVAAAQSAAPGEAAPRRFAATELADAEVGLAASIAHLRYITGLVSAAGSPDAAAALRSLTTSVRDLHQTVLDVRV